MSKEGGERKFWYTISDHYCHCCENCPDAPSVPCFPPLAGDRSRFGMGGKSLCGKCIDLGEKNCEKPSAVPMRMDEQVAWRQAILTNQDFMKAQEERVKYEEYIKGLLLPENEEALRKFFMPIASAVAASMAKKSEFKLNVEGWVNYQVSRLRKNKKFREEFIRDCCG